MIRLSVLGGEEKVKLAFLTASVISHFGNLKDSIVKFRK